MAKNVFFPINVAPWCSGSWLHSTKPELRFCAGSNPTCGMSQIWDGEDLWKLSQLEIWPKAFRWLTIPQKQFINIIISSEKTKVTQFARLCKMTCLIVALESFDFPFHCILSYQLLLVFFLFTPYIIPELFYRYSRWDIFNNY